MSSQAQVAANRANAQLSTGPTSHEGKAKSSLNAVKTGLTGRTVLLPGDDAAAYQIHIQRFFTTHQPSGDAETALVQSIADTEWRLLRIPSLEMGIYAIGRLKLAAKFESHDASVRDILIEAHIYITYQRQLSNLSIQEGRLRKQRENDLAELKSLQSARQQRIDSQLRAAMELYREAEKEGETFDPSEFGFEFPTELLEERIRFSDARRAGYSHDAARAIAKVQTERAAREEKAA